MTKRYRGLIAAGFALAFAATAQAQDAGPPSVEPPPTPAPAVDQVIYKGVVGNLLENVPIDPEKRVQLQRGNAVVSNVASGRSLAALLGIANPVLMIGGLIWGLWSASQIRAPAAQLTPPLVAALPPDRLCLDSGEPQTDSPVLVLN